MEPLRFRLRIFAPFFRDEHGSVLAESLVVIPFVTLFSVAILEFGNMFWQKEQIETGLAKVGEDHRTPADRNIPPPRTGLLGADMERQPVGIKA